MTEPTKSMRIRVNASRTAKGWSIDATIDTTELVQPEWADDLQRQAMGRLELVIAELNDQYPREG